MGAARLLTALLLALGLGLPATTRGQELAAVVSEGPEQVALAVYQDPAAGEDDFSDYRNVYFDGSSGLALVTEWRTLDVPAGESRISFRGVAEGIVPQTAALDGLPARMVERNQDFDLLSPGSLVARSVGERVTRIRTDAATGQETREQAVIRSGPDGVVLEIDGRLEALSCGGPAERLVFDRPPEGLSDRPTLSVRVRTPKAGRYRVRLTYLAVGVMWAANYAAQVSPDGETLDLTGWITLKNNGRTGFDQALTQVVAGDVERSYQTRATVAVPIPLRTRCWPMDTTTHGRAPPPPPPPPPAPMADGSVDAIVVTGMRMESLDRASPVEAVQSELGDYKLYTLPSPTTVAAQQTKQVLMLRRTGVKYERVYIFRMGPGEVDDDPDGEVRPTTVMFRTRNTTTNGLGLPLPGGKIAVMTAAPRGGPLLAGEGSFRNTGLNAPLEMDTAETVEVQVRPVLTAVKELSRNRQRGTIAVEVTNNKPVAAKFELRLNPYGDFKVSRASPAFQMKPAGAVWALTLQPGETRTIRYTVTTTD